MRTETLHGFHAAVPPILCVNGGSNMTSMDFSSSPSLKQLVYDNLKERIINGELKPGTRLRGLYSAYDFFPTIMEIAGVQYKEKGLPGKSFAKAVFSGEERDINDCVVVYSEYGAVRMIRQKEWKYIRRYPEGPDELYNLKTDPDEMRNMIDKAAPELIELLNKRLDSWFSEHTRPETDGRQANVTGAGQNRKYTNHGFEPGSFEKGYETLPIRQA